MLWKSERVRSKSMKQMVHKWRALFKPFFYNYPGSSEERVMQKHSTRVVIFIE